MSKILNITLERYKVGKRLVAPLIGFPGLKLSETSIKLGQQNYKLHYETMKAILDKFQPDVILPMMDLSLEANALGRYAVFKQDESATIPKQPFEFSEIASLKKIDINADSRIISYLTTLKLAAKQLRKKELLGAYITGPFTLAALILGADETAMATMLQPDNLKELLVLCTEKIQDFAEELIKCEIDFLCVLDPTAGLLAPYQFTEFSGNFTKQIVDFSHNNRLDCVLHICGNTMQHLQEMVDTGADALSLDSADTGVDLLGVARNIPDNCVIIGNLNPTGTILNGTPAQVCTETTELLDLMKSIPNFILSTGCDLPFETPLPNIAAFMSAGRSENI